MRLIKAPFFTIQNELYAGRLVWNKVRMIKDPDTGKRLSRPNANSERKAPGQSQAGNGTGPAAVTGSRKEAEPMEPSLPVLKRSLESFEELNDAVSGAQREVIQIERGQVRGQLTHLSIGNLPSTPEHSRSGCDQRGF